MNQMKSTNSVRRLLKALFKKPVVAKPAVKVESKPAVEVTPTAKPQVKSRLLYDSQGQVLPVRLRTPAENRPINRIELLRRQAQKIINWFSSSTEEQ